MDSFTLSDNALIQCVPIAITSDSVVEPGEECFTFTISTATTVAGLTLSPSETEICVSDSEGTLCVQVKSIIECLDLVLQAILNT